MAVLAASIGAAVAPRERTNGTDDSRTTRARLSNELPDEAGLRTRSGQARWFNDKHSGMLMSHSDTRDDRLREMTTNKGWLDDSHRYEGEWNCRASGDDRRGGVRRIETPAWHGEGRSDARKSH